jgi:hypothetical protein
VTLALAEMLGQCVTELRKLHGERVDALRLGRSSRGRASVGFPALAPPGKLGEIEMSALVRAYYGDEPPTLQSVTSTWDEVLPLLNTSRPPLRHVVAKMREVFPSIPFVVTHGADMRMMLPLFLLATSWHYGRLVIGPTAAQITLPNGHRLQVDRTGAESVVRRVRWSEKLNANLLAAQIMPIGKPVNLTSRASALFRHLMLVLPEYTHEILTVISVAVHSDPDYESLLLEGFEVHWDPTLYEGDTNAWDQVMRLIDNTPKSPYTQIQSLLVPSVMSRIQFRTIFGPPGMLSTKQMRKLALKYRDVKLTSISSAGAKDDEEQMSPEALELIEMQRMLGGSA